MKKRLILYFCFAFMLVSVVAAITPSVSAKEEAAPVSYGLYILAEDSSMAMAGLTGNKISFEAEDFARAMNLSGVRSITITEVPPTADGELLIGSTVVNKGQTISGSNISLLSYSARAKSTSSSYFKFRAEDAPYEIRCNLYMLDSVNHAPTLNVASDAALKVSTHKNITLYGTLPAYDPDGDELIIEVVSYPKDGILLLADRSTGAYTYTPGTNYTGKDSFTYVARDKYGNYSAGATVNLTVNKRSTSAV
ncbi:MAG: cadherin-like domain-containing protein, partial [Clostridia bacterium]|nr:cadherin-like domain-containing protein [Clostridia bacterium]